MIRAMGAALGIVLIFCAHPLKEKGAFWYNGYVYGTQAYSLYAEGKLEAAVASYRKALGEARRLDIPQQAALYTFNIGRCFLELERLDSALACFSLSYAQFASAGDSPAAARAAGFCALTYCEMEKSDSAFAWYGRGEALGAGKSDQGLRLLVHGRLVWQRDHGKEALTYFEEAYALQKKQKAFHAMAELCYLRAVVRHYFGDFPEAKKLIDEALALSDKSAIRPGRSRILLAASAIYGRLGDEPAGKRFLERAKECAPVGKIMDHELETMNPGKE